jgi:hypothetical protein
MAVWVTGALPPPYLPYPARRPDVPDAKHFPDGTELLLWKFYSVKLCITTINIFALQWMSRRNNLDTLKL